MLVVPARKGLLNRVRATLHELDILELPFPTQAAELLAQLRADTRLPMPDCCVLLSAEAADASIASFDARLTHIATRRGRTVLDALP